MLGLDLRRGIEEGVRPKMSVPTLHPASRDSHSESIPPQSYVAYQGTAPLISRAVTSQRENSRVFPQVRETNPPPFVPQK